MASIFFAIFTRVVMVSNLVLKEVNMKEKICVAIGTALAYSAIFIGTYEITVFAFNRCAELLVDGKGLLDEAWENFRR